MTARSHTRSRNHAKRRFRVRAKTRQAVPRTPRSKRRRWAAKARHEQEARRTDEAFRRLSR